MQCKHECVVFVAVIDAFKGGFVAFSLCVCKLISSRQNSVGYNKLFDIFTFLPFYNVGMTVYVEYAFLDNFTMDCLLLFFACVTLKISFKWWRMALGAFVGTVCALATVYVSGFWSYVAKAACLFLMCVTTVGFGKKLFWHILLTLAYTFVMGGAIVGIFNLLKVQYVNGDGLYYNMPVPLFVYFLGVALVCFLTYSLTVFVRQTKKIAPYLKKVQVFLQKPYTVTGFCDSGNTATCDGLPVCFVTKKFGNVQEFFAQKMLCKQTRRVEVATLTGAKEVVAVQTELQVEQTSYKVFLALPSVKCETQYELLLPAQFSGGEK